MDTERDRKKRRRSMRTLRRQSGALPINLLSTDDQSESTNIEGKLAEENLETFGSIWYESQAPMKDRRKRRSNIFATLPIQAIHENEEERTGKVEEEHTRVVSVADDCKTDDKVENVFNGEWDANLCNKTFVAKVCNETSGGVGAEDSLDQCIHTNSSPTSATCNRVDDDQQNTIKKLIISENSNLLNSVVECSTPLLRDNKEHVDISHDDIQTPPDVDVSKVSPSSMSPDFPMSLSGADYTNMLHDESYLATGINTSNVSDMPGSQDMSDLSLSDKENSIVANNSCGSESIAHQAEKDYLENVSPGFLSVCKTFAGKVVSFVKTSPSYLTNALLNGSNNSDISASPALKGSVNTPSVVRTSQSDSVTDDDETTSTNAPDLVKPCNSQNENVPHCSSLMGSARKNRDKKSFLDTFSAISEELMKDTESKKPAQQQESNNIVEDKVKCEEESVKPCTNMDDLCVPSNHVALPKCVTENVTSLKGPTFSPCVHENNKEIATSLAPSVVKSGLESNDLQMMKDIPKDSDKEFRSSLIFSDATNTEEHMDKTVGFTSSVQEHKDVCQLHTPDIELNECCSTSKSSERERKRRALDIAYVETNDSVDYSGRNVDKCIPDVTENKLEFETTAEHTRVKLDVGEGAAIPDTSSKNSDNVSPILSLITVISKEKKSDCDPEINIKPSEDVPCVKKGRRRAFGFLASEKQREPKAEEVKTETAGIGKIGAHHRDDGHHKHETPNSYGLSDDKTSEHKAEHENMTNNNNISETLTLIDNSDINDDKLIVPKQKKIPKEKKTRRRSEQFHFISHLNAVNETNTADTIGNCADTDRIIESEKSVETDSVSSARLISEDQTTQNNYNTSDNMNIRPAVSNEMPKKPGHTKSAVVATLKVNENITEADMNVSVTNEMIKTCNTQLPETSEDATPTVTEGYVNERNDVTKQTSSVKTNKPRKPRQPKSSIKSTSIVNPKHGLESAENRSTKVDAGNIEPKKRGRRKSADATSLSIQKSGIVEKFVESTEITDDTRVITKRGRRKSADAATLNIKKCGIEERGSIELEIDDTQGKTKRGRRKSADAASLNIKKIEENGNIEIENNDDTGVQKKRGRRKSADAATLKLMILSEDETVEASEMKRGKKRKLETSEDIEMLYRNKNYIKPEEKKPWQTIVESPIDQTQVYKRNRLQRFIDFEKPSQLKLRRRFQKASKNGWDAKKRKHCELDDQFVEMKLARVWSELDEPRDLRSQLQSIIETT